MQSPAAFLQNSSQHSASLFRQAFGSLRYQAGAAHPGDYTVAAQSTPNMSVQVSAGMAWVPGSQVANISGTTWDTQADYFALNDGPVTLTIATADATNPRIDLVYVAVQDSFYAGATNTPVLGVVTGTPAPSPTVPALPANALSLAQVSVVANATSITNSKITASVASMLLANTPIPCTSATRPTGVGTGQTIYETDTGLVKMWNGAAWLPIGGGLPFGMLTGTGTTPVASGSFTAAPLATVSKLAGGATSPAAGRLAAPLAGWYSCSGAIGLVSGLAASGRRIAGLAVNGGSVIGNSQNVTYPSTTGNLVLATSSIPIALNAGDYVQILGFQESGGAGSIDMSLSFLQIHYLGPL